MKITMLILLAIVELTISIIVYAAPVEKTVAASNSNVNKPLPEETIKKVKEIFQVTDNNFSEKVLNSTIPVLVIFYAKGTSSSRMIIPSVLDVVSVYAGRLKVVRDDVNQSPETPKMYLVKGTPSVMLFIQGEIVASSVGAMNKTQIETWLNKYI